MSKDFAFKELDVEGMQTLEAIAAASQFNEWMYKTTAKNLQGRILEIGSGIGNISAFYLRDKRALHLSDIRDNYCEFLQEQFGAAESLEGIVNLDLVDPDFDRKYAAHFESFDGLFALNVVEHIEDDQLAIANAKKLLKKGGRMVILVPAFQALYNHFDTALEHYRRYNKKRLARLFEVNGLQIERKEYFNLVGIAGWFFSGTILKKRVIPSGQMKLYNALVPIFKIVDRVAFKQWGLSVIVEGTKV
ncbi:MAG: methyltransferase [Saprospiraceae bacterium]